MATDLYEIRVLAVDLDRREVEFRVFVVYYDTGSRTHAALPVDDPAFFLRALWHEGRQQHPIGDAIRVEQFNDREWMVKHARWFVEQVERTAVRNDPPSDETWAQLKDFYYERSGGWADEDLLVQADYVVRFTDRAWIEHLEPLQDWGDLFYPLDADRPDAEDLPRVPNPHRRVTRKPFKRAAPSVIVFSDDSRFLAVTAADGKETVVYGSDGWSEHERLRHHPLWTSSPDSPDGGYLVEIGEVNHDPYAEEAGDEVVVRRADDGVAVIHHWPGGYVPCIAWSPDGRWLALAVEHLRGNGGGEVQVMPIGLLTVPPLGLGAPGVRA